MLTEYDVRLLGDGRLPNLFVKCEQDYLDKLDSPSKVYELMVGYYDFDSLAEEYVYLIAVDNKLKPLGIFEISHGTVNGSLASPREIFMRALLCGASTIILTHNHPSGDTHPSKYDIKLTENLKVMGDIMNIPLSDHIIVGENYFSFKEEKYL